MKNQYLILAATFFIVLFAVNAANFVMAVNTTNVTIEKTPTNATVFLENGTNIAQPRTPLLSPPGNITDNITNTNVTAR